MAKSKRCESCNIRPASSESPEGRLCRPCLTEAEWENSHSDYNHGAGQDQEQPHDCWICFPELNEAQRPYVQRAGTSRAGMEMNVRRTMTGREKAETVKERLDGMAVSISVRKGVVTLKAATEAGTGLVLRWDTQGRYLYDSTEIKKDGKTRKARNVAAALRAMRG